MNVDAAAESPSSALFLVREGLPEFDAFNGPINVGGLKYGKVIKQCFLQDLRLILQ